MNGNYAYINGDGRLSRDRNALYLPKISTQRVVLVFVLLSTLLVTNPANGLFAREIQNMRRKLRVFPLSSMQESEWDQMVDSLDPPKSKVNEDQSSYGEYYSYLSSMVTTATKDTLSSFLTTTKNAYSNYGIFVLGKKATTINLTGLLHTVELCRTDSMEDFEREFCLLVEEVSFQKQQKKGSLAYAMTQFGSWMLITAVLFSFCTKSGSKVMLNVNPIFQPWLLQMIVSIWTSTTVFDVIHWNWIAKSALTSMERLIMATHSVENKDLLFILSSIFLLFVVGIALTHYATRRIVPRHFSYNLDGMFAACLAYTVGVGNQRKNFLLRLFPNLRLNYPTLFWFRAGQLLLMNQLGPLVAVLIGGALGHAFGMLHAEFLLETSSTPIASTWKYYWLQLTQS